MELTLTVDTCDVRLPPQQLRLRLLCCAVSHVAVAAVAAAVAAAAAVLSFIHSFILSFAALCVRRSYIQPFDSLTITVSRLYHTHCSTRLIYHMTHHRCCCRHG